MVISNMNVEGEQNAAARTSAPSTTDSIAAVQAQPITSVSFDPSKLFVHLRLHLILPLLLLLLLNRQQQLTQQQAPI